MVNGINSNNPINSYTNNSVRPSKADMDTPAFLLQYDEKGVVWDRNEKEKESETREPAKNGESRRNAVADGKSDYKKTTDTEHSESTEAFAIGDLFGGLLGKLKTFFANVLNFIWYGDEKEAPEKQEEPEKSAVIKAVDSAREHHMKDVPASDQDEVIKDMIARHDMDGVVDILTKNHTIRPARNSTLLTYYNRHGKIVDLSQTNTGRILHGDRNVRTM